MMFWLLTIVLAYLFFGLSSLADKLILIDSSHPKSYTFYVGFLGIAAVVVIPFIKFGFPLPISFVWIILEAITYIAGMYSMFVALHKFDVSKAMATIGGLQPILILIFTFIFLGIQIVGGATILAFVFLFIGSILISIEKRINVTKDYLRLTIFSALMFSLEYVFAKLVFLHEPFLKGFIWMRIFSFAVVMLFLLSAKFRKEVFQKHSVLNNKTKFIFFFGQVSGGTATILQSFSISLVPLAFLSILNALRGLQYIFLFLMTLFFSYFLPKILKEKMSKTLILQKIISILLIVSGLVILAFVPTM